jgi:hypothetical protein
MFILISVLALTNICIIPYYFTSQFEYFIIEYLIPLLNNIYISKNQQRMIEVKIYTKLETEPIKLDILYYEELNKNINETNDNKKEIVTNNKEEIVTNNDKEEIVTNNDKEEIVIDNDKKTVIDNDKKTVIDNNKEPLSEKETVNETVNETDDETDDEYYLIF